MKTEIDYYDPLIAGRWVFGQCIWIGSGWCARQLPHLGNAGTGVHRKRPHLGGAGKGVNRQGGAECLSDRTSETREFLYGYMCDLAERLRRVRVCCGDWSRICGPSPTVKLGTTGVFLDPPYADEADRQNDLYATDSGTVAHDVRAWAIEWGADPRMRIALCGYDGEHNMPGSWEALPWKARGGYGSQGDGRGRDNSAREMIWFSPHCLRPQENLFADLDRCASEIAAVEAQLRAGHPDAEGLLAALHDWSGEARLIADEAHGTSAPAAAVRP